MKRHHLLILVAVVVLHALAWWYYGGRAPSPIVNPEIPGSRQIQRIEDFKQQTAVYDSFDKAAAGLSEPVRTDGHDLLLAVGLQSNDDIPQMQFAKILADRRVSRLFEYLKSMSPAVAANKSAKLGQEKYEFHTSEIQRAIEHRRKYEPLVITNENREEMKEKLKDRPKVLIHFNENQHAACASLFLCAHYCEPTVTLRILDQWADLINASIALTEGDPKMEVLLRGIKQRDPPEPLFYVNLYVHILRTHERLSPDEISRAISGKSLPPHEATPLCAWDASTNPFDFTHNHQFTPVDTNNQQLEVTLFRTWGRHYWEVADQQILIQALRQLIESRNPGKS